MALNFQLIDKATREAVSLSLVDDKICTEVLNCQPHSKHYGGGIFNWFDSIGFQLACGKTLEDGHNSIREYYQNSNIWADEYPIINSIISYLQERYTTQSWTSFGK